jgi:hypothetical protein
MSNEEIIENVRKWQTCGYVHPLTCNDDKCRADLEPIELSGIVVLRCPVCGLIQDWIPEMCCKPIFPDPLGLGRDK